MVNGADGAFVFVYERKRRATHLILNTQVGAELLDERGFSCAHLA